MEASAAHPDMRLLGELWMKLDEQRWFCGGRSLHIRLVEQRFVDRADSNLTECAESKECHAPKHHYDECVERVTGQIENDGKASEDCVEECRLSCIHSIRSIADKDQSSILHTALPNAPRPSSSLSSSKCCDDKPSPDASAVPLTRPDTDSTLLDLKEMTRRILDDCKYRSHV
jgi:hypothetical protein